MRVPGHPPLLIMTLLETFNLLKVLCNSAKRDWSEVCRVRRSHAHAGRRRESPTAYQPIPRFAGPDVPLSDIRYPIKLQCTGSVPGPLSGIRQVLLSMSIAPPISATTT